MLNLGWLIGLPALMLAIPVALGLGLCAVALAVIAVDKLAVLIFGADKEN